MHVVINQNYLYPNICSIAVLTIGYIYAERYVESRSVTDMIIALLSFFSGWFGFMLINPARVCECSGYMSSLEQFAFGVATPLSAMIAHYFYLELTKYGLYLAISLKIISACVFLLLLILKSRFDSEFSNNAIQYNLTGFFLIVIGVLGYTFTDPMRLDYFKISQLFTKPFSTLLYTPALLVMTVGFALIGVANSFVLNCNCD